MTKVLKKVKRETDTLLRQEYGSLSECVEVSIKDYFAQLEGHHTTNLYDMLLAEVEAPMLKACLLYTSDAADE